MRDVIYPVRAQMSALQPPQSLVSKPLDHTYGLVDGERIKAEYLIQEDIYSNGSGGAFLLGGGRKYAKDQGVGVTDDSSVDAEVSGYLRSSVGKYFDDESGYPGKEKMCDAKYMWSGIMGFSADERPWVGKVPGTEGQYILAGFEGHGMAYTTGSAQALAQILHHRYPVLPDDPYSTYWNRNICVALYEFKSTGVAEGAPLIQGQELSIEVDDVIDIIEKGHNGWWFGAVVRSKDQDRLNTFGWFPSNFVEEIPIAHSSDGVSMNCFEPSLYARLQEYPEDIFSWFPRSFTVSDERLKHAKEIAQTFDLEEMRSRNRGDASRLVVSTKENQEKEDKEAEERSKELYTQMLYDRYKLQFAVKLLECGKDEDNLVPTLESTALTNIEEKYLTADADLVRKAKLVKPLKQLQRLAANSSHQVDRQRISDILSKIDKDKNDDKKQRRPERAPPVATKTKKTRRKSREEGKAKTDAGAQTQTQQHSPKSRCSNNGVIVRDFAVEALCDDQPVEKDLRASQILPHQHPLIAGLRTDEAVEGGDEWVVIVDERPE
ncbi:hypothetical protein TWF696_008950 [Orbilia brochopaga]|uniref:SH3 domain-containing protein n=1 Tax=Orbilia brochopaga TaxID=3140254 RepID=A0AAV9UDU0_9PEZI